MKIKRVEANAPAVVLVAPQMAENIGFCARAMKNCGFTRLIVASSAFRSMPALAFACATGGEDVLASAKFYPDFERATADFKYLIATTARPRDLNLPVYTLDDFVQKFDSFGLRRNEAALVFGPERMGLTNELVSRCDAIMSIPAASDYTSFNLGQSVLLAAHAFFKHAPAASPPAKKQIRASKKELLGFFSFLHENLDEYYAACAPKSGIMRQNLQNILNRAALSEAEVKSLYGAVKALKKSCKNP